MIKSNYEFVWNGADVKIKGKKVINKSAFEIGLVVEGQAKLLADKNYGYLAASITTQSKNKGTNVESPSKYRKGNPKGRDLQIALFAIKKPDIENEVFVGTPVFYAPYREYGTIRTEPHPFLRPALDLAKGKELSIIQSNAKTELGDYLK